MPRQNPARAEIRHNRQRTDYRLGRREANRTLALTELSGDGRFPETAAFRNEQARTSGTSALSAELAGVPGLEPRLTGPEPVGLPITPYPNGIAPGGRMRSRSLADSARGSQHAKLTAARRRSGRPRGPGGASG